MTNNGKKQLLNGFCLKKKFSDRKSEYFFTAQVIDQKKIRRSHKNSIVILFKRIAMTRGTTAGQPYYVNQKWLDMWLEDSKKGYVKAPGYGNRDVRFRTLINFGTVPSEVHADETQIVKVVRGVGLDVTLGDTTHYVGYDGTITIPAGTRHRLASASKGEVSFQSEYIKTIWLIGGFLILIWILDGRYYYSNSLIKQKMDI